MMKPTPAQAQSWNSPVGATPFSASGQPTILMCPPTYFTVAYAINPWMVEAPPCDTDLAKKQWEALYNAITRQAGAQVELLEPVEGLPDLVFTANAAFVYNKTAVIARYKHPERQPEEPVCAAWFEQHGFDVVRMPNHIPFEGAGDALIWEDRVFAGYKTRTDIASHSLLTAATGLPVLSMELISDRFYHIDVCLCPLADGHLIYSPDAFDEYGLAVIEANVPPEKRIPVTRDEAARFACNAVNINDTILFNQGSSQLMDDLKARGFQVIPVDLSEFLKAGGSSKCLTLRIG
jgi:N-dimethylarginine dimethylaminohydrolase